MKITDKTSVAVLAVPAPIKTDFDPPYGPAHIEHPSNKHSEDEDE